ncbi:hypothetical protein BLM14_29980 (plasmid) [Phyllobacterium zundukense]|uniref:nucleotidyltransferase family protein n=1 Tax=Phyllobacterium zundukense TaxID=1867719 RepID=UPI000C1C71DE|nr:GSU2403 family nucleotidyltransferase fold protein [Phyllobacterium zundukense]ATU96009.1 hypothetical protein BLM14_29980 [Phyllobacterium zundukense]
MQRIDHTYQVLYSELAQRTLDASFTSDFPISGRFITMESRGRRYWYFDTAKEGGGKNRRYVGPVDDEEITRRVENFKDLKSDARARRKIVSTLVREAYLPRPEPFVGEIVQTLAIAGFFRLRGVLVGTVAFQCYPAILGMRLPNAALQTADADFAQFHSISAAVGDALPPVLDVLRKVDPTFRVVPHQTDSRQSTKFINRSGYAVEFLTPNTGSVDYGNHPASMPALGGASAQPLRFLDFLIHQPVRAVMLYASGVPILVPAPERYAVHKLIVGSRRRNDADGTAKSRKDRLQSRILMEAMIESRQDEALADAYMEAWDRGVAWKEAIIESMRSYDENTQRLLKDCLAKGVARLGGEPNDYGLA